MQMSVLKTTLREGDGITRPQKHDIVEIHYTGFDPEGKKFASSDEDLGEPLRTEIGTGKVIRGWDEGIMNMTLGEKAHLVVGPDCAYGAYGYPPLIQGGATLTFEIELLKIEKPQDPRITHLKSSH